jgi:hypothetical protein
MAIRRLYSLTVNGILRVYDVQTGDLSQHYGNVPVPPGWGRTAADLTVDDNLVPDLATNGGGLAAGQACTELLGYYMADLGLVAPNPRAF